MEIIGTPAQIPAVYGGGIRWLYKVQNVSDEPVPRDGEEPLTFDANDGYHFEPGQEMIMSENESEFLCEKRTQLKVVGVDKQDGKGFRVWPPPEGGLREVGGGTESFQVGTTQEMDGFGGEHFRQQQTMMERLSAQLAKTTELNAKLDKRLAQVERRLKVRKKKVARRRAPVE